MDEPKTKQSGFSVLEVLLGVLAIAVLIGVSVVVYQHNKTKVTDAEGGNQTTTQQTTTTTNPGPTVTYLTVTEWGVKVPLSDQIKDAYYVTDPTAWTDPDGLSSQMWLGLKSFTSASCNAANNNDGKQGAIGAILRVPSGQLDQVTGRPMSQEYPNGVTINGYYYTYQSSASGNPCASDATLQPFDSAFATAIKGTVQATAN